MPDAARAKNVLGFADGSPANARIGGRQGDDTEHVSAVKGHLGSPTDAKGLLRQLVRFRRPPFRVKHPRHMGEDLSFETTGTQLARDPQRPLQPGAGEIVSAEIRGHDTDERAAQHLGPRMADAPSRLRRGRPVLDRLVQLVQIEARPADHVPVGDLDVLETMLPGEVDATAEKPAGGSHATAQVVGVPQAAEGVGFVPR